MISRIGNKGFTLIEVMITAAVLSLTTVLIYESFFISLDSFNYCSDYLNVASWMNEKIWQAQDGLSRLGTLSQVDTEGTFINKGEHFNWNLSSELIDTKQDLFLYKINLVLFWQAGHRRPKLIRTAYAKYEKK